MVVMPPIALDLHRRRGRRRGAGSTRRFRQFAAPLDGLRAFRVPVPARDRGNRLSPGSSRTLIIVNMPPMSIGPNGPLPVHHRQRVLRHFGMRMLPIDPPLSPMTI
jgi:hypothetical protein